MDYNNEKSSELNSEKSVKRKAPVGKTIFIVLLVVFLLGLVLIGGYAYTLKNSPDYITLGVGESYTLTPRESDFLVRSYNAGIVTPTGGSTVTANAVGDAVIGIRYTYFDRDFYRFRVIEAPTVVTLSKSELSMGVTECATLKAQCSSGTHDFDVTYLSSDENVATVSVDGTVTATGVGKCTLYATAYNGVQAQCEVDVSKAPTKVSLNHSSLTLGEGEELVLKPIFKDGEFSGSVDFVSSDDEVVTIINGNTVCAVNSGECTVVFTTHNSKTAQCKVTVRPMPQEAKLIALDKYDLDATVTLDIDITKDCAAYYKDIVVSDEQVLKQDDKNPLILHPQSAGKATVTLTLSNSVTDEKTITVGDYSQHSIDFDILNQFPTLPTGCEVVSLTSVLNHYGFDVSMTTMAEKYMPKKEYDYYSVSPHDYFLGTPYSFKTGMGCFSGCIVKTAQNYFRDKKITDYKAVDISGCSTDELYNYLENDVPVITWVTSGFVTVTKDSSWYVGDELVTWCNHEHCLVTTGYDIKNGTVTVADDSGGYSYNVSMSQFERVFKGMGSMAVVILKK